MTSSAHGAVHRYTFDDRAGVVLLDMSATMNDEGATATHINVDASSFEGQLTFTGRAVSHSRPVVVYVAGVWSSPAAEAYTWTDAGYAPDSREADDVLAGGVFRFEDTEQVELRVGLSYVDLDQAHANLESELAAQSFADVESANVELWRQIFERVRIGGVSDDIATLFFTALYNANRMPTRFDGVDGRYRGLDGEIHTADFEYMTDISLWDTYRTLHPWLILTDPDRQRDCVRSLIVMAEQGGYVPRWPAATSYTNTMLGDPADQVIAGSALKGIDGIDYEEAFDALIRSASTPVVDGHPFEGRAELEEYLTLGYVSAASYESVALTLEYAWSDWALANLADLLGRDEADTLRERGRSFRNVFDPGRGFFLPRMADGSLEPGIALSDYSDTRGPFAQGTAWQWRHYGIHDPETLISLYDHPDDFHEGLSDLFALSELGRPGPISNLLPPTFYWHGNEPDLHAAYLFHEVDAYPELAYWVRQIQTRLYTTAPDGLPGNDDGGTLSAWYLFNALGLYPVAGTDRYYLSTPLVPYAELQVTDGSTLVIEANGAPERYLVETVTRDDLPVTGGVIHHTELYDSTLVFTMGATP